MYKLFFSDILYSQYSIFINKAIPSITAVYITLVAALILINYFMWKLKPLNIVIINVVILSGMYLSFIFPYRKGERINAEINCGNEFINKINEYAELKGVVPESLDSIEKNPCLQNIKIKYVKVYMEKYNERVKQYRNDLEPLKKDSYVLLLYLPELSPEYLKYTEFRKEIMIEDD